MGGILPLVLQDGDMDKVSAKGPIAKQIPYIEMSVPGIPSALDVMDERAPPRLMKTHMRYEFFKRQV